ncbi:putative Dynein heavy chain 2; axonemal [Paratrimastix pyriformis]|uniref:Dynein heavy chain 2 n=1 Tax=Paratrimastix pyriformis TaxID=342808 RepID=A0ABQ8UCZ1_9EUKA|nr:putative Dynein heavy chain 2; axonemal [Paratrimastix pyriformis]
MDYGSDDSTRPPQEQRSEADPSSEHHAAQVIQEIRDQYIPRFLEDRTWPESVRKDFLLSLHRSMAALTEIANKLEGTTVLYIPPENVSDPERGSKDKELCSRLYACLIHWTRQIKDVLSEQDTTTSESMEAQGPLAEIEFWRNRTVDLSNILKQLNSVEVTRIVTLLRLAKAHYVEEFQLLQDRIQRSHAEAVENHRFLTLLQEPCEKLAQASPQEIPGILPRVMHVVCFIWTLAAGYRPRMKSLIPKVSNEVINRCRAAISIEDIFGGRVDEPMGRLKDSIRAIHAWARIYQQAADLAAANGAPFDFDTATIFAHVNAFMQRCQEMQQVCSGQLQFGALAASRMPTFPGSHGVAIEQSFQEIFAKFARNLQQLQKVEYNVLDVKETRWADDFALFKDGLRDLEAMLTTGDGALHALHRSTLLDLTWGFTSGRVGNIIATAFHKQVTSVEGALELLAAFEQIALRPQIEAALLKCRREYIWELFKKDLKRVQAEYEHAKASPPRLHGMMPHYGGSMFWAHTLAERLTSQYQQLQAYAKAHPTRAQAQLLAHPPPPPPPKEGEPPQGPQEVVIPFCEGEEETIRDYQQLLAALELDKTKKFQAWVQQLSQAHQAAAAPNPHEGPAALGAPAGQPIALRDRLAKASLLVRDEQGFLAHNFDRTLLCLFNEIHFWQKHPTFNVPPDALELFKQAAELRVFRESVLLLVRDYNLILSSLTASRESAPAPPGGGKAFSVKELFSTRMRWLDKKIAMGLSRLTWASRDILNFVKEARDRCREVAACIAAFQRGHEEVLNVCRNIALAPMVRIDRGRVYDETMYPAPDELPEERAARSRLMAEAHPRAAAAAAAAAAGEGKAGPGGARIPPKPTLVQSIVQVEERLGGEFSSVQKACRLSARPMGRFRTEIETTLTTVYERFFRDDEREEVQEQWYLYKDTVDELIYAALKQSVRRSIQEFRAHVVGDGKNEVRPLFAVQIAIKPPQNPLLGAGPLGADGLPTSMPSDLPPDMARDMGHGYPQDVSDECHMYVPVIKKIHWRIFYVARLIAATFYMERINKEPRKAGGLSGLEMEMMGLQAIDQQQQQQQQQQQPPQAGAVPAGAAAPGVEGPATAAAIAAPAEPGAAAAPASPAPLVKMPFADVRHPPSPRALLPMAPAWRNLPFRVLGWRLTCPRLMQDKEVLAGLDELSTTNYYKHTEAAEKYRREKWNQWNHFNVAMEAIAAYTEASSLTSIDNELGQYHEKLNSLLAEPNMTYGFLTVDCSPIKSWLKEQLEQVIQRLTNLLTRKAKGELYALRDFFESSFKELAETPTDLVPHQPHPAWLFPLQETPTDLVSLRKHVQLLEKLKAQRDSLGGRFEPIKEMFAILERHEVPPEDKDVLLLNELPKELARFEQALLDKDGSLVAVKAQMKDGLELSVKEFGKRVDAFRDAFLKQRPDKDYEPDQLPEAIKLADRFRKEVQGLREDEARLQSGLEIFKVPQTVYKDLATTEKELNDLDFLLGLRVEWQRTYDGFKTGKFASLVVALMEEAVRGCLRQLSTKRRDCEEWDLYKGLRARLTGFQKTMPLITDLRSRHMRERHWAKIKGATKQFDETADSFTLETVFEIKLNEHTELIQAVVQEAVEEAEIEDGIRDIKKVWDAMCYALILHKESKEPLPAAGPPPPTLCPHAVPHRLVSAVLWAPASPRLAWPLGARRFALGKGGVDDVYENIDNHLVKLSGMKGSRFLKTFAVEVEYWETMLATIQQVTDKLIQVQKAWAYLESIFGAGDEMKAQLQAEATKFAMVNGQWIAITNHFFHTPNVVQGITAKPDLGITLTEMQENLDRIRKNLQDFLDKKRLDFPRFYFLSDDDLLQILGQARDYEAVRPHLKKCFASLADVDFDTSRGPKRVTVSAMRALEKDAVAFPLERQTLVSGRPVEHWLADLEKNMQLAVRSKIYECLKPLNQTGRKDRKWINQFGLQFLLTAGAIFWTATIQDAIGPKSKNPKRELYELRKSQYKLLQLLTQMIAAPELAAPENAAQRTKLVALITIEVHARDVLDHLYHEKVTRADDFLWQMQLRFYWEPCPTGPENPEGGECVVRQTDWQQGYCNEFLGCTERLVITPLTDRCYITLTTALSLKLGGNPQGPAGTGKTETVKDLSKALGIYIIIFNCSDSLEAESLGSMFWGLAQTGAWACFDEFNRIVVEVLSVVAQQVQTVLDAVRAPGDTFTVEGRTMPIKKTCGIFLTMNPGYAGRSELPDNLKALVRPVAMMVPDSAMIARIKLYSEGFKNSDPLSEKVDTLYQLAQQQLSRQPHYDWGLRAIKSVLVTAGAIKSDIMAKARPDPAKAPDPAAKGNEVDEEVVVLRACRGMVNVPKLVSAMTHRLPFLSPFRSLLRGRDMNVPKLVSADARLFARLLRDLFHGVEVPRVEYGALQTAMEQVLQESPERYQVHPQILFKTVQLYETKNIRHGVMLVGPTGGGKSVIWNTLARAKNKLKDMGVEGFEHVQVEVINPKSITNEEMFGAYDVNMEWHEGITSTLVRRAADDPSRDEKWILFDGPVDTLWIESMNSVLDDSKVLTLNNQARITFPSTVTFLFEVEHLAEASPATVSRCGIVYVDDRDLGWQPYVNSWLAEKEAHEETRAQVPVLRGLFQKHVERALAFRREQCKEIVATSPLNAIQSLCRLYDCVATKENGVDPADTDFFTGVVELWFFFALMWSVGGSLDEASRKQWEQLMRELEGSFPAKDTVYEYVVDPVKKSWVSWEERLPTNFKAGVGTPFHKLFVPTIDTVRFQFLLQHLMREAQHTLFIGNPGTGKTAIAQNFLGGLPVDKWIALTINMSARTESRQVQAAIESRTAPRGKKFSPLGGKKLLVFVDDLNMPAHDAFHSQPPLELIRQWMTYGSWYNRKDCSLVQIIGMQLLASMGPPGGGRTSISPRLFNRFNVLTVPFPSEREVKRIFRAMIEDRLNEFEEDIRLLTDPLTACTLEAFKHIIDKFRPTPDRSHYLFNMRDLAKVFQGIRLAQRETIDSKEAMIRLWVHECYRVFHDRLISPEDRDEFKKIIREQLNSGLGTNPAKIFRNDQAPLFCDFLRGPGSKPEYEEVKEMETLKRALRDGIEAYNDAGAVQMQLVLFVDAMQHLCRISRIIRRPRGNALLVGIGGSGRQSLTRLATSVAGYQIFTIEVTRNFQLKDFREAMKTLYKQTCIDKKETVFLLSDTQIAGDPTKPNSSDVFFEDVNNMLTSGEIPNLFPPEDLGRLLSLIKDDAIKGGLSPTPDVLYQYFIDRVRDNLHLVLCMSPVSPTFRAKLRNFPGLVNCTTIDWFSEWPPEALAEVADSVLQAPGLAVEEHRRALCQMLVWAHQATIEEARRMKFELQRQVYVTPTSFRELCDGYCSLLTEKRDRINRAAQKLRNGRDMLKTTSDDIACMKIDLDRRNKEATKKQEECDELLVKVVADRMQADEQAKKVASEQDRIEVETARALKEYEEANADMERVKPELDAAKEAVRCLTAPLIAEVRGYATPPAPVKMVLGAVMMLLGSGTEWDEIKARLQAAHFKEDLVDFDAPSIKEGVLRRVEKAIAQPGFEPTAVGKVSKAAGILCLWVRATVSYKQTDTRLSPIIKVANEKLDTVRKKQEDLKVTKEALARVQKQVAELERKHKEALQASEALKRECAELALKLDRADKLVNGLSGERERWLRDIARYEENFINLVGDCVLASAFLAYAGPFTSEFRTRLVTGWKAKLKELKLPHSPDFNFVDFLSEQTTVREWTGSQGLPNDGFSIENGVLVTRGRRWPLVIDPQGQAKARCAPLPTDRPPARPPALRQALPPPQSHPQEWIKVMEQER